jgi:hypothetical protein
MGVKNIAAHLNQHRIFTRDGGRWGIGQVHRILTQATYVGPHEFNKRAKNKELKPASEIVTVEVPPLIDQATFGAVQAHLRARNHSRDKVAPVPDGGRSDRPRDSDAARRRGHEHLSNSPGFARLREGAARQCQSRTQISPISSRLLIR